ncbi:MAG: hypothetical protein JRI39_00605 [Deltaproteobacteria bacterium]|nr:hypothetical protein [Deltaproteobacteria bacterium]
MAEFTTKDRDLLIRIATKVDSMYDAWTSETGGPRCATHTKAIENLEKETNRLRRWIFWLATTFTTGFLSVVVTLIASKR